MYIIIPCQHPCHILLGIRKLNHFLFVSTMPCRGSVAMSSLLPLFEEQVSSPAMFRHSMAGILKAVYYINSGQTPVMAFIMSKCLLRIKCSTSVQTVMQRIYFMILRGIHIETTAWEWWDNRRWAAALVRADITTPEMTIQSNTRHSHQVTASVL